MPRKAKKSSKKGGAAAPAARVPRPAAQYPMRASSSAIPYASSSMLRTKFEVSSRKSGGSSALRVHILDQLSQLKYVNGSAGQLQSLLSDTIPFTLQRNAPQLALLGEILPKLQGFASIASRYQVLSAKLHYQSTAPASKAGVVGCALVPGSIGAVSSVPEIASFDHSAVVPVWQSSCTPVWKNSESRFYHTNATVSQELVPFTIVRVVADLETSASGTSPTGLFWLELDIEFLDLKPMDQTTCDLKKTAANTVIGGQPNPSNLVSWDWLDAMDGLFDWTPTSKSPLTNPNASPAFTNVASTPGSIINIDGGKVFEWFGDLLLDVVSTPAESQKALSTWEPEFSEVKSDYVDAAARGRVFPGPWVQPPRVRTLCEFKTYAEAVEAKQQGYDPIEVFRRGSNAAGDVSVYLLFQPEVPNALANVIAGWALSGGTGAQEVKLQTSFTTTDAGQLGVLVIPTGTEHRSILATSSMSLDAVSALTSGAP